VYQEYYGLTERPFDLTPNPRYLYLTPMHREALAAVQYGITARRGIVIVIGEAGTGKTTIVRAALRALKGQRVRHTYLNNPALTRTEFLQFLARAFGLGENAATSKVDLLAELTAKLARYHGEDTTTVLIVDEAQSLPHDLLEEIRLLANIETSTAKLLQVVMVGQPELAERLNDPSLRQLKQRVAIRATLQPLDLRATSAFVAGRLRVAGGQPAAIFTPQAVEMIYRYSGGVARTINVICDNALLAGFATEAKPIGPAAIEEVARDFDLKLMASSSTLTLFERPATSPSPPTPPTPAASGAGPADSASSGGTPWLGAPTAAPATGDETVAPAKSTPTRQAAAPDMAPAHSRPADDALTDVDLPEAAPAVPGTGLGMRDLFSGFGGRRRWFS
jgi:general secretion pathway protein A